MGEAVSRMSARLSTFVGSDAYAGSCCADAVKGAESPNELRGVYADHPAPRKLSLEDFEGGLVVCITVGRHEHQLIGNVEIRVAGRKPLAFVFQESRHR